MSLGSNISRFPWTPPKEESAAREHAIECAEQEIAGYAKIFRHLANESLAKLKAQHIDNPELEQSVEEVESAMDYGGFLK